MWSTFNAPDMVEYACRKSLENLGLDFIDLFLMHFPVSLRYESDEELWPKNENNMLHVTYMSFFFFLNKTKISLQLTYQ